MARRNAGRSAATPGRRPEVPRLKVSAGEARRAEQGVRRGALVIVLCVLAVYANSFSGPFIFDDIPNILANPAIRAWWPPQRLFDPPPDAGIATRPMVSLSLALNYALSGYRVWSYHALNLLIHVLAALALFGLLRRTLLSPALRARFGGFATPLATAAAVVWAVHPLQTQAVTYIIQRCESLMGLFFLATFYCAVRGWDSPRGGRWHALAVLACLCGTATKEVMVAAPILVLGYDVAFNQRSIRPALAASPRLYIGLAATLVPLAILTGLTGSQTLHTDQLPVTPIEYARTQPQVILHYLKLVFWPAPLVLDYGWPVAPWFRAWPAAVAILVLVAATLWALRHHPRAGFVGVWFFLILAPTSSVVPLQDLAFEHRMYLPLAGIVAGVVVGGYALLRGRAVATVPLAAVTLVVATALGATTFARNRDYRSEVAIWSDTVSKRPTNARAQLSLGVALDRAGRKAEAARHTAEALRLNPNSAKAQTNHGIGLLEMNRAQEAIEHFRRAIELDPAYVSAHSNLGIALCQLGRLDEGVQQLREALRLDPRCVEAHYNLAIALRELGQVEEGRRHYEEALRLDPRYTMMDAAH